jgi:hypothetical protein
MLFVCMFGFSNSIVNFKELTQYVNDTFTIKRYKNEDGLESTAIKLYKWYIIACLKTEICNYRVSTPTTINLMATSIPQSHGIWV